MFNRLYGLSGTSVFKITLLVMIFDMDCIVLGCLYVMGGFGRWWIRVLLVVKTVLVLNHI